MEPSPGFEQLDTTAVTAAFLGSPEAEGAAAKAKTGAAAEGDEPEADSEGDTAEGGEEEGAEGDEAQGEESGEAETEGTEGAEEEQGEESGESDDEGESDEDDPIDQALKDKPKLRKRVKKLFAQNKELKQKLAEKEQEVQAKAVQPLVLEAPTATNPLAGTRSAAEVDQAVEDALEKTEWLDENPDGGTYNGQEVSANQVKTYKAFYRAVVKGAQARRDYLAKYADSLKGLGLDPVELVKPQAATRESSLIQEIPELARRPDYLQVLADAKAGRELREKKARGITLVEVDPKKPKVAAKDPKPGKPAAGQKGSQSPSAREGAEVPLATLRERAAAGDRTAQQKLQAAFIGG